MKKLLLSDVCSAITKFYYQYDMNFCLLMSKNKTIPHQRYARYSEIEKMPFDKLVTDAIELDKSEGIFGVLVYLERCNLIIIDIDNKNEKNGFEDFKKLGILDHELRTFATHTKSGGMHYIFKRTQYYDEKMSKLGSAKNFTVNLEGSVELKGSLPTPIPITEGYDFINDTKPIDIPNRVVDIFFNTIGKSKQTKQLLAPTKIVEGSRNNNLFQLLLDFGRKENTLTFEKMRDRAYEINNSFAKPLPKNEAEATALSVFNRREKIYSDQILEKIVSEGRQRLVADIWIDWIGDIVIYTKAFGWCFYNREKGFWEQDQEETVRTTLSNFCESLIERQKQILTGIYGFAIETGKTEFASLTATQMEIIKSLSDEFIDEKAKKEHKSKLKEVKQKLEVLESVEKKFSKSMSVFKNIGEVREIDACMRLAKGIINSEHVSDDDLLFNLKNGTYDLEHNVFRQHYHGDFIFYQGNITYDKKAECLYFENFILQVMGGCTDSVEYLQVLFGYCLSGLKEGEQKLFILTGTGGNGKGVLMNLMWRIFGELIGSYNAKVLFENAPLNEQNYAMAGNQHKRILTISEFPGDQLVDEELIKKLTGNDMIDARNPAGRNFQYRSKAKIFIVCNKIPRLSNSPAIERRLVVIPFDQSFETEAMIQAKHDDAIINYQQEQLQDPEIEKKLDAEISGIFNWLVEGFVKWRKYQADPETKRPFDKLQSKKIREATRKYLSQTSNLVSYLREHFKIIQNPPSDVIEKLKKSNITMRLSTLTENINKELKPFKPFTERRIISELETLKVHVYRANEAGERFFAAIIQTKHSFSQVGTLFEKKSGIENKIELTDILGDDIFDITNQ